MSLEIEVEHDLGGFTLEARIVARGRVTALFGRSGAGKSSIVNLVAGTLRPRRGRVAVAGRVLVDTARGVYLPAHRRRVGVVFQEARLFPHLTVRGNLLYGRLFRRGGSTGFDRVVEMLGIGDLLDRRPGALSGGEAQRVAIGRALLAAPEVLLLDEPLASLDEARKAGILPFLERLRDEAGVPIVYVSHALAEVTRLADTLVVLSDGKVAAAGPVAEVLGRLDLFPLTGRAEAGTLIDGVVEGHDEDFQLTAVRVRAGVVTVPRLALPVGAALRLRVRARDVILARAAPAGTSLRNALPGVVRDLRAEEGSFTDVLVDCAGDAVLARVTRKSAIELGLAPGSPIVVLAKTVAFDRRALAPAVPAG